MNTKILSLSLAALSIPAFAKNAPAPASKPVTMVSKIYNCLPFVQDETVHDRANLRPVNIPELKIPATSMEGAIERTLTRVESSSAYRKVMSRRRSGQLRVVCQEAAETLPSQFDDQTPLSVYSNEVRGLGHYIGTANIPKK